VTEDATQGLLDLVDWRRRVGNLYRGGGPDELVRFRHGRDELFRTHPQSPVEPDERSSFHGLRYFPHNPACRVPARFEPGDGSELVIETGRTARCDSAALGGWCSALTVWSAG
jgi:uncharacterized protein (DUF1684 family)